MIKFNNHKDCCKFCVYFPCTKFQCREDNICEEYETELHSALKEIDRKLGE